MGGSGDSRGCRAHRPGVRREPGEPWPDHRSAITVAGVTVLSTGASERRKHAGEPPNPSGSFGNGTSCVWLFVLVLPPDAPEATGSGGTSPPCSRALVDFGVSHGAGTPSHHLSTTDAWGEHRERAAGVAGPVLAYDDMIFQCTLCSTRPGHGGSWGAHVLVTSWCSCL